MPEALISLSDKSHSPSPLTQLTEEERMFYATVRQFAQETIAPAGAHAWTMSNSLRRDW